MNYSKIFAIPIPGLFTILSNTTSSDLVMMEILAIPVLLFWQPIYDPDHQEVSLQFTPSLH